jgi:arabinofuranosyltransferase
VPRETHRAFHTPARHLIGRAAALSRFFIVIAPAVGMLLYVYWSAPRWAVRWDFAEDAFIMFRYAKNLAAGHGLVWNIGRPPVEGATAFLWTVSLAGIHRLGVDVETAARILAWVSALCGLLALLVPLAAREPHGRLWAAVAALAISASPLSLHLLTGFETLMFSAFMTATLAAHLNLVFSPEHDASRHDWLTVVALPLSALGMSLTRPEGSMLAVLWFAVTLLYVPSRRLAWAIALGYVLPGTIYFLWRWHYFGYLLPNTFYAKVFRGSDAFRTILGESLPDFRCLLELSFPFVAIILACAVARPDLRRRMLAPLVPLLVFCIAYLPFHQVQNVASRYQTAVLPALALAAVYLLGEATKGMPTSYRRWFAIIPTGVLIAAVFNMYHWTRRQDADVDRSDRETIGKVLRSFADRNYVLVTSEAGYLPYYSGWIAIDAAGLCDDHIAHNGLTADYLLDLRPTVIMFHGSADVEHMEWGYWGGRWNRIVKTLYAYAKNQHYTLAAAVRMGGRRDDMNWYFVSQACPEHDALVSAIAGQHGLDYVPLEGGQPVPE